MLVYPKKDDSQPVVVGLVPLVGAWLHLCGYGLDEHDRLGAALAGSTERPDLMCAALDVLALLKSTAEGRQALADFLGEPVFQDAKSK